MKKLILHIPHSSSIIPFFEGFVLSKALLNNEILKLTDWYTDELFMNDNDIVIKASFSQVFCDVERFADDSKEVMFKFGMGVMYETCDNGDQLRIVDASLRKEILNKYYWPHHQMLNDKVNHALENNGNAFIVDCHSFPNIPFDRDLNREPNRPDFNIGTDDFHTPQKCVDMAVSYFSEKGYSVGIDWPYEGSIVPLEHYGKNTDVNTIMLEVNRKLYLNEGTNEKSNSFGKIKEVVKVFIELLRDNCSKV